MIYPIRHKIRTIWEWLKKLEGEYLIKQATVDSLQLKIKSLQKIPLLPDLIIKDIVPVLFDSYAIINIIIKNIGKIKSLSCNLNNELNGDIYNLIIPTLYPRQEVTLSFNFYYDPEGSSKIYTITSIADNTNFNKESNEDNNTLIKDIELKDTVPALSDLIITDITITDIGSGLYDIAYIIKNNGLYQTGVNTGRINIKNTAFFIDSSIPELAAGQEIIIHTTWYYDINSVPESFILTATADVLGQIQELNENNNSLDKDFFLKKPIFAPPYPSPVGYHWVWRGVGAYQDLGADSFTGTYDSGFIPPGTREGWGEAEWMAALFAARTKARDNAQMVHSTPNNYQSVNEFTYAGQVPGGGYREESIFCDWTAKHFSVINLEIPNPPYTLAVIPVQTVSGMTYWADWINNQVLVPVIDTNYMGSFVVETEGGLQYIGGNSRSFAIPYTPNFDIITTADVNLPVVYSHNWYGFVAQTKYQYYSWTFRYIELISRVMGWILTRD